MTTSSIIAFIWTILAVTISIVVVLYVFMSICYGFIFKKAGEKFWKGFIPYYSTYIIFKISWKKVMFIPYLIILILKALTAVIAASGALSTFDVALTVLSVLGVIIGIADLVYRYGMNVKLCWSFERGMLYALGLTFLPLIFLPILAFGKRVYIAPDVEKLGIIGF